MAEMAHLPAKKGPGAATNGPNAQDSQAQTERPMFGRGSRGGVVWPPRGKAGRKRKHQKDKPKGPVGKESPLEEPIHRAETPTKPVFEEKPPAPVQNTPGNHEGERPGNASQIAEQIYYPQQGNFGIISVETGKGKEEFVISYDYGTIDRVIGKVVASEIVGRKPETLRPGEGQFHVHIGSSFGLEMDDSESRVHVICIKASEDETRFIMEKYRR